MQPRAGSDQLHWKEPHAASSVVTNRSSKARAAVIDPLRGEPDFERIDQDMTAIMSVFAAATCPQLKLRCHSNNLIGAVLV